MDYPLFTPSFLLTIKGVEAKGAGVQFFCSAFFFWLFCTCQILLHQYGLIVGKWIAGETLPIAGSL